MFVLYQLLHRLFPNSQIAHRSAFSVQVLGQSESEKEAVRLLAFNHAVGSILTTPETGIDRQWAIRFLRGVGGFDELCRHNAIETLYCALFANHAPRHLR